MTLTKCISIFLFSCQLLWVAHTVVCGRTLRSKRPIASVQITSPDWKLYHTTDQLWLQIDHLIHKCNPIMEKLSSPRDSQTGSQIPYIRIHDAQSHDKRHPPKRIMIVFGEHGREIISSELAWFFIYQACQLHHHHHHKHPNDPSIHQASHPDSMPWFQSNNDIPTTPSNQQNQVQETTPVQPPQLLKSLLPSSLPPPRSFPEDTTTTTTKTNSTTTTLDPLTTPRQHLSTRFRQQLHQTEFFLVPLVNEFGRRQIERGDLCNRTNERGVDLNRNWDLLWGTVDQYSLPEEENPGTAPFSEFQSRALRDIAININPDVYVTIHSGDYAMLFPWDHTSDELDRQIAERLRFVIDKVAEMHCPQCSVGNVFDLFKYHAYGTATDYMFGKLKIPYVYTWEIYGDLKAHHDDCYRMFNPLAHHTYAKVLTNWVNAFLTLSALVHERSAQEEKRMSQRDHVSSGENLLDTSIVVERDVVKVLREFFGVFASIAGLMCILIWYTKPRHSPMSSKRAVSKTV